MLAEVWNAFEDLSIEILTYKLLYYFLFIIVLVPTALLLSYSKLLLGDQCLMNKKEEIRSILTFHANFGGVKSFVFLPVFLFITTD